MRILHTSDIHLRGAGTPSGKRRLAVLEEICSLTADCRALIIAGDLFDSSREGKGFETRLRSLFTALSPCKIFIIPGNHDTLGGENPLETLDIGQDRNVRVMAQTPYDVCEADGVKFYGFPFQRSKTTTELLKDFTSQNKLENRVAIMHGTPLDRPELAGYSYAPENREEGGELLIRNSDLREAGFNYVALGHIHRHDRWTVGNSLVSYSGSPDAVRVSETEPRAVNIVTLDEKTGEATILREPLQSARAAITKTFFTFPGEEERVFETALSFLRDSGAKTRPVAVIEGLADGNALRRLKDLAEVREPLLAQGLAELRLKTEDASATKAEMINYSFLRKMHSLSETADTPQRRDMLRRCMALGWRALNGKSLEPADILGDQQ